MNYQKHYDLLIEKSKNRILNGYKERHHILPKCFGGTNETHNIVSLWVNHPPFKIINIEVTEKELSSLKSLMHKLYEKEVGTMTGR